MPMTQTHILGLEANNHCHCFRVTNTSLQSRFIHVALLKNKHSVLDLIDALLKEINHKVFK